MKNIMKELEERENYLDKLFKVFGIIIIIGFLFFIPSYFELHIVFNFLLIILVVFGLFGMFVTLMLSEENINAIILINKERKNANRHTCKLLIK